MRLLSPQPFWCLLFLTAGFGCTLAFDGEAADIEVVGTPAPHESLQKLNRGFVKQPLARTYTIPVSVLTDPNGALWVSFFERSDVPSDEIFRLRKLFPSVAEGAIEREFRGMIYGSLPYTKLIFAIQENVPPWFVKQATVGVFGDPREPAKFPLPAGPSMVQVYSNVVLHWVQDSGSSHFQIFSSNSMGIALRELRWPPGVDPAAPGEKVPVLLEGSPVPLILQQDRDGHVLARYYEQGVDVDLATIGIPLFSNSYSAGEYIIFESLEGNLFTYDVRNRQAVDLKYGASTPHSIAGIDPQRKAILWCDDEGLKSIPYEDPRAGILRLPAKPPCWKFGGVVQGRFYYYWTDEQPPHTHRVPLDGSGADEDLGSAFATSPLQEDPLLLSRCGRLDVYFKKKILLSESGEEQRGELAVTDGWIDDWQFMSRGRLLSFDPSCSRMRFLEYAARSDGLGELRSVEVSSRSVLRLAHNVSFYDVLADGRVMAYGNAAGPGQYHQLLLIDESKRTARRLLDNAAFASEDGVQSEGGSVSYAPLDGMFAPLYYRSSLPDQTPSAGQDGILIHRVTNSTSDLYFLPIPPR